MKICDLLKIKYCSTGGVVAKKYEFPHQALLGYNTSRGPEYFCGGSLISSNFILTGKVLPIFTIHFK
jgi:hypothetical protein